MEFKHPKYYAELRKQRRLQALKQEAYKLSSTLTQEESPQAKGSSFSPKSTSSRIREPG
jgi:hypothetical protein